MSTLDTKPQFGGRKKQPAYYVQVQAFIASLQPTKTLRQIAELLNQANYRTPTGLPFDRQAVANVKRSKSI